MDTKNLAQELDKITPAFASLFDMTGKVVIITGGCTGLGFAVTNRFGEAGAKVVITGRRLERGLDAQEYFRGKGYDVTYFQADVCKVDQCYALVDFTEKTYGAPDIMVPCAATWDFYSAVDTPEEVFDRIINTNLKSQYFMVQAAARSMIKAKKGGKICMISSIMRTGIGDVPYMNLDSAYVASKSAIPGLCISFAREFRQYGISVNCVAPGAMRSDGQLNNGAGAANYGPEYWQDVMQYGPEVPQSNIPDEVARLIFCMCSPVSDFMYGVTVDCDGGSTMTFMKKPWSFTMEGAVPGIQK